MKFVKVLLVCAFLIIAGSAVGQEIKKVKITEVEKIINESTGPLVINMWATWCGPCVEELPYFLDEYKNHKEDGLQLILVSLDFEDAYPQKIEKFMSRRKVKAPVLWLDETNADYFCPKIDPRWGGAIPASVFINNTTGYRSFFEGQMSHKELKKEIMAILEKKKN